MVTISITFLIVNRMISQLKQVPTLERRISSIFFDPRRIIREHNRLFPRSGLMLAFWLSIIYLVVWLTGIALSLAMHPHLDDSREGTVSAAWTLPAALSRSRAS
jgi:hypothetical protein